MIRCEFCGSKARNNAGMSMHLRGDHKEKWKGSVKASFSKGYNGGTPEPRRMNRKPKKRYPSDNPEYRKARYLESRKSKKQDQLEDPRAYINNCPGCGKELIEHYLAEGVQVRRRAAR